MAVLQFRKLICVAVIVYFNCYLVTFYSFNVVGWKNSFSSTVHKYTTPPARVRAITIIKNPYYLQKKEVSYGPWTSMLFKNPSRLIFLNISADIYYMYVCILVCIRGMFAFQKWMFYHPYLDATDRYNNCGCLFRHGWTWQLLLSSVIDYINVFAHYLNLLRTLWEAAVLRGTRGPRTNCLRETRGLYDQLSGGTTGPRTTCPGDRHTIEWGQIVLWQQYFLWWSRISKFMCLALCLWSLPRRNCPRQRLWETARCSLLLWTKLHNIDIAKYSCLRSVEWHKTASLPVYCTKV